MMSGVHAVAAPANQCAGPPDPRHHLVEAHEEAVPLASLGQSVPEADRRGVSGERRPADRLAEERGDVARAHLLECLVERLEGSLAGGVETPGARRDVQVLGQVGHERAVHPRTTGQREGLHRGAVIRLCR